MSIPTILFDLDGTLVDSALDFHFCLNKLLIAKKKPPVELSKVKQVASNGSKAMLHCAFEVAPEQELQEEFLELYQNNINNLTKPFPGILELLDELDKHYIKWGIVTNKPEYLTITLLSRMQLLSRCSVVVCGDTTSHSKPHPAPILYACEKLEVKPEDCIFIGDSKIDIEAGKKANTKTILVKFGYSEEADLIHTKPDHTVSTTEELTELILKEATQNT